MPRMLPLMPIAAKRASSFRRSHARFLNNRTNAWRSVVVDDDTRTPGDVWCGFQRRTSTVSPKWSQGASVRSCLTPKYRSVVVILFANGCVDSLTEVGLQRFSLSPLGQLSVDE